MGSKPLSWMCQKLEEVPIIVGGLTPEFFTSLEMAMLNSFVALFLAHCCRICWKPFELRVLGATKMIQAQQKISGGTLSWVSSQTSDFLVL